MEAQRVKQRDPTLTYTFIPLPFIETHFVWVITNWLCVKLTSTTRNQQKLTTGKVVTKQCKGNNFSLVEAKDAPALFEIL